jgi:hypothetical protein
MRNYYPLINSMGSGTIPSTLNTGLYAVYKAESNANDSFSTYNGTAQGGLTYSAGKDGNAFTYNGTNAYVSLPNNSLNFTGDFSYNLWCNLQNIVTNQDLLCNADYNSSTLQDFGYRIQFRSDSRIRVSIYGSSAVTLDSTNLLSTNTWFMITVTRKASTGTKIYINGTLSNSNTSIINPDYTGTFSPSIGAYSSTTTPLTLNYLTSGSKIDEVCTWNKELTSTEITELYTKFYPF